MIINDKKVIHSPFVCMLLAQTSGSQRWSSPLIHSAVWLLNLTRVRAGFYINYYDCSLVEVEQDELS